MSPVNGYILAGGRSERFGSDKARAVWQQRPMLLHTSTLLQPYVAQVLIIAREVNAYADLGLTTLADGFPGHGPMAGLETALTHSPTPWLLLASCDTLGVLPEELQALLGAERKGVQAVAWQHANGDWEPLWALYHASLLPLVRQHLQSGARSLQGLLDQIEVTALDGRELEWLQVNRLVDLERAQRRFKGQDL